MTQQVVRTILENIIDVCSYMYVIRLDVSYELSQSNFEIQKHDQMDIQFTQHQA